MGTPIHDLNNQLAVIDASAALAATQLEPRSEAHDHLLRIRSSVRKAADLIGQLDTDPKVAAVDTAEAPDEQPHGAGKHVLVVDDDEAVRRLIVHVLEKAGFSVAAAEDAERALDYLGKSNPADLLVTDVHLPGRSGPELVQDARRRLPDLRVVFVSGDTSDATEFDPVATLRKPFVASDLLRAVGNALAG